MVKKNKNVSKYDIGYFYETEEDAVINYIKAETAEEKNEIFEQTLRAALTKMTEIIIKRYKLFIKNEDFDETVNDTIAFIITKIDRYKKDNGRAYSYIQTICKNHLIARINENNKSIIRNVSYDDHYDEINEDEKHSYSMPETNSSFENIISTTVDEINNLIQNDCKITKSELMVGNALAQALINWDVLFPNLGSNKFNKSSIILYIKESTNLPTKEIKNAMKKYRLLYFKTKNSIL